MPSLFPFAISTSVEPWAAAMAFGFLIGIAGHISRSILLIVIGILIVGGISIYFAFGVGRLG